MKFFSLKSAVLAATMIVAAPVSAQNFSYTGTLSNPNDVLLFNFVVASPSNVTLRTYSYAGGTNAAGTVIARGGFDPILALFNSSGQIIGQNDDGGPANVPTDINGAAYDTYLQSLLGAGSYTVSVQAFSNFALGPNLSNGFQNTGSFGGRTNAFAFDILGVSSAVQVGAVPEPATWAMMLVGFGAIGVSMRRRRRATLAIA